jgi:hypothetical protein
LQLRHANLSGRGLGPVFSISLDFDERNSPGNATVADTVTNSFAVVAFNSGAINLVRLLRALGFHVTQLVTVGALDDTAINRLTSIQQAFNIFLRSWPTILLLWTSRLVRPTPSDRVLLVEVALKVHLRYWVSIFPLKSVR